MSGPSGTDDVGKAYLPVSGVEHSRTAQNAARAPSTSFRADARRAGACNGPRPIGRFRCQSSTIPPLTASRMWDRMVFRQWAAEQKVALGPRSGMWVCRLTAEEPAEATAVASGLHESAPSTLAIVSRRPVPESAIGARESVPRLHDRARNGMLISSPPPISLRQSPYWLV